MAVKRGTSGIDTLSGTNAADTLIGLGGDDTLDGGGGADTYLVGLNEGFDTYHDTGMSGTDVIRATANNVAIGLASGFGANSGIEQISSDGPDPLTGVTTHYTGVSIQGGGGDDILDFSATTLIGITRIDGGAGNDTIIGSAGADTIFGNAGDDTITGGRGIDTLDGGDGSDTYRYTSSNDGFDIYQDSGPTGTDRIVATVDNLAIGLAGFGLNSGIEVIDGGTTHHNVSIRGGSGGDVLDFSTTKLINISLIDGSGGPDTIIGSADGDRILGSAGADSLSGGGGNDQLEGGAGNDTLDGGTGDDIMLGGDGNDVYVVDSPGDVVTEAAGAGTDEVRTTLASYVLGSNVEKLTFIGTSNFTGTGNNLDNVITGGKDNDTLDGGAGNDRMVGGTSDDIYFVDATGDVVVERANEGIDEVRTTLASYTLGGNVENLTFIGTGAFIGTGNGLDNVITGGVGDDMLTGAGGNDTLDGGTGADKLFGGAGNDTYILDNAGDVVTENAHQGTDEARTTLANYTLPDNVENLIFIGTGNFSGTGNALNNVITGGGGNDTLDGGAGGDTLEGGAGSDIYIVDNTHDVVTEDPGQGIDTIKTTLASYTLGSDVENLAFIGAGNFSGAGNSLVNVITGGAGSDTLTGGGGNDTLDGREGADKLLGGTNDDTYIVDNAGDLVIENPGEGTDTVKTTLASYTLTDNVENLTSIGTSNFSGTGNTLNNVITGGGGNDTLDGGAGGDSLIGGTGDDTYIVDNTADVVMENPSEGTDTIITTLASYTLGNNFENLAFIGAGDFTGTGNDLFNTITGGAGNDTLIGGAGNDTLDGRAGADKLLGGTNDDTYIVDNTGDVVTENPGGGTDTVKTTLASYTLPDNLENLTFLGGPSFTGTGNALDNVITGAGSDDTLDGGTGNDIMIGGAGNDVYYLDAVGDMVFDDQGIDEIRTTLTSYTLLKNNNLDNVIENLAFIGTGDFIGTGNTFNNVITGGAGNDTLSGGVGNDTLIGDAGNDTLDGGTELDLMTGGAGNDIYYVDSPGDVVVENVNEGIEEVRTTLFSYTLGDNVENLTYLGSVSFTGTGNALDNVITGGAGNNTLYGGDGDDTLVGGAGFGSPFGPAHNMLVGGADNDTYIVEDVHDQLIENPGEGIDTVTTSLSSYTLPDNIENLVGTAASGQTLTGNTLANTIIGGAGDDRLDGGIGNDALDGGGGNDQLFGGTGNDTLAGDAGNDTLDGGVGSDQMAGGADDDVYFVHDAGDVVTENFGEGTDTVETTLASYTLPDNVENLIFTGTVNFNGTGNDLDNAIAGGTGNDALAGGGGNDTLTGGAGNDTLVGGIGGLDTADYAGDVRDYGIAVIDAGSGNASVEDLEPGTNGDDGADELIDVEAIRFNNYTVYLDGRDNAVLAAGDMATGFQGTALTISSAALLANDYDFDGDTLSITNVGGASNGTVAVNAVGDIVFTPDAGFAGDASFTYTVSDGRGSIDIGTVAVAVLSGHPPVAQADSASTDEDTAFDGASVLANDSDPDPGDLIAVVAVNGDAASIGSEITLSSHAKLTPNANGTYRYDPNGQFEYLGAGATPATDSFTYTVSDGHGGPANATVTITITGVNDPPVAQADNANTTVTAVLTGAQSVLVNDHDPDNGDLLVISAVNGDPANVGTPTPITLPSGALLTMNSDGTYIYDPNDAFSANGSDHFNYTVSDGHGASRTATVTITLTDAATPPSLSVNPTTGDEDTAIPLDINAALTDSGGSETLVLFIDGVPAFATLSVGLNLGGGEWLLTPTDLPGLTITPPPNSDADFTLTVRARSTDNNSGAAAETDASLPVTINALADTPILTFNGQAGFAVVGGNENQFIPLGLHAALTDTDGSETLTVTITPFQGAEPGLTITDGVHSYSFQTMGLGGVMETKDVSDWNIDQIAVEGALDSDANFLLQVDATATEADGGSSATTEMSGAVVVVTDGGGVENVVPLNSSFRFDGPNEDVFGFGHFTQFGRAVSDIGDINDDGYTDLIVAAPGAMVNGDENAGSTYVLFGGPTAGAAIGGINHLSVDSLDGSNGFRVDGSGFETFSGDLVAGGGDFNGDGFADYVISTGRVGFGNSGAAVIFGHNGAFAPILFLSNTAGQPDGSQDLHIDASNLPEGFTSIANAGDVNGDGYDDIIFGIPEGALIVYGSPNNSGPIDLSALDGTNGSELFGRFAGGFTTVTGLGDVNGDGYGDVAFGLALGPSYVVFGAAGGLGSFVDAGSLDGQDGFRLESPGPFFGRPVSVSSAGDVNGDGFDDLIVGGFGEAAHGDRAAGVSYVVFGHAGGFPATIDLTTLDGTDGFQIDGAHADDNAGLVVSRAGDFNGDGYDDLVVVAPEHVSTSDTFQGEAYVIFGHGSTFDPAIDLASLPSNEGLRLDADSGGFISSVSAASDVNGDGIDDLVVGGGLGLGEASYLVLGQRFDGAPGTGSPDVLSTAADDARLLGYAGNDTLTASGNRDVLLGGPGDDTLIAAGSNATLIGGGGSDSYQVKPNSGTTLIDNRFADGITTVRGEVDFGAGIDHNGVWFERVGNDLQVDVMGTPDHITLLGWFAGDARAQVESFNTENGMHLDTQVASLVQAMATYSQANPAFDPTQTSLLPNDPPLSAVLAAAWHL